MPRVVGPISRLAMAALFAFQAAGVAAQSASEPTDPNLPKNDPVLAATLDLLSEIDAVVLGLDGSIADLERRIAEQPEDEALTVLMERYEKERSDLVATGAALRAALGQKP